LSTQHASIIFEVRLDGRKNMPIFVEKHQFSVHYHRLVAKHRFASRWQSPHCKKRKIRSLPYLGQLERHFSRIKSQILGKTLTFSS